MLYSFAETVSANPVLINLMHLLIQLDNFNKYRPPFYIRLDFVGNNDAYDGEKSDSIWVLYNAWQDE